MKYTMNIKEPNVVICHWQINQIYVVKTNINTLYKNMIK